MNLEDWRLAFTSLSLILIITINIPVFINYLPKRYEQFLSLSLLGEEGIADQFFPENDMNISVGERIRWKIHVYNHMGESKYISVRVKLVNSKMLPPNSSSCSPTPTDYIYEIRHVLLNNETWQYPFQWFISNITQSNESISITKLNLNNDFFTIDLKSNFGGVFRFVFELWVYNEKSEEFNFGWEIGEENRCAWNQIWFNVLPL